MPTRPQKNAISERQELLLRSIIEAFVETAQPVASRFLVEEKGLSWSPATIRNEMALLEEQGYITHPHTSAGRIPTERGWRHYLTHDLKEHVLGREEEAEYARLAKGEKEFSRAAKLLARAIAEFSHQTVIIGFSPHDVYYTGVSNLIRHPEFQDVDLLEEMTSLVDHCDDTIERIFEKADAGDPLVLIGRDNPFGRGAGSIVVKWKAKHEGLLCLLGPVRMDYSENLARVRLTWTLLA